MELAIWKGAYGLPSLHTPSLEVLAYCRFSGVPFNIRSPRRYWHPDSFPQFRLTKSSTSVVSTLEDVIDLLTKKNYNADADLTQTQQSDCIAYRAMLRRRLGPVLDFVWWSDMQNYVAVTRPFYASVLSFPSNYFVPGQIQRGVQRKLEAKYAHITAPHLDEAMANAQVENALYKEAQECLTTLSERLGNQSYFFGESPTSLDAIVYAHLAPLLVAPFPHNHLQNHLKACTNLKTFLQRITSCYFSEWSIPRNGPRHATENHTDGGDGRPRNAYQNGPTFSTGSTTSSSSSDDSSSLGWLNLTLSVFTALAAMTSYALWSGIIQIEVDNVAIEAPKGNISKKNTSTT